MRNLDQARALVKRFEGMRLTAYRCPSGVWTIGVGHTGDVKQGQRITAHQAEAILDFDIENVAEDVEAATSGLSLTDNEFNALVSFAFNVGVGALRHSTLLKKLRAGDKQGAADQLPRWVKARGVVLPGLVKRREAERELFLRNTDVSRP